MTTMTTCKINIKRMQALSTCTNYSYHAHTLQQFTTCKSRPLPYFHSATYAPLCACYAPAIAPFS
jgi:hypothetical protein